MMMSFMFIVGFISLLFLPLTWLAILYSLQFQQHLGNRTSGSEISYNIFQSYLARSNLSSVRNGTHANVLRWSEDEEGECSVCLCGIRQGEEARELPCRHVFHEPCLDAWLGTGRATCPLCRGRVSFPAVDDNGAHLILLRLCSRRDRGHDDWWIR